MARNEYHFVITLLSGASGARTTHGLITASDDDTRFTLYEKVFRFAGDEQGVTGSPPVAFFSLEPNDLGASDG